MNAWDGVGRRVRATPRRHVGDESLALLREGYAFIPSRCRRLGADVFETRLMLQRAYCMTGPEAARAFYQPDQVTRRGGMPHSTYALIQDDGSVMTLDGAAHRRRKAMFLSLVGADALARLAAITARHWRARIARWPQLGDVVLLDEAQSALCAAICEWAGLALPPRRIERLAIEFGAMIDGTGSVGPRNWRGHALRAGTERRMRNLIRSIRAGTVAAAPGSAAAAIAAYMEDGRPLDVRVAALELINVLRATVSNARYIAFGALALHDFPETRPALERDDPAATERFVLELRRFYPFIPLIGGRVVQPFGVGGHTLPAGAWVLMDLYGTNHDPRAWDAPEAFRPDRFIGWRGDPDTLVSHGAGDHATGHRCPGEGITMTVVAAMLGILVREARYHVPLQNLAVDLGRMPARPASGFVVTAV